MRYVNIAAATFLAILHVPLAHAQTGPNSYARPVRIVPVGHEEVAAGPMAPAGAAPAETVAAPGLELSQLEELALSHNPTLQQAQGRIAAAQGRAYQARLYPNPRLQYMGDEMGGGSAGFQGGSVMQEIVTGGKRRLDMSVAFAEVSWAEQEFSAQQQRVLSDVRIEFFHVLAAQRTIDLATEIMGLGEQGVKAAEQLYKAKQVALVDVLQAQVERDTAALALETARHRHVGAWRRLAAVVGQADLAPAPLAGTITGQIAELTWVDSLQRLLTQSPEVAAAVAALERAQFALRRAQQEPVPNLDLELGFQHDNTSGDDVTNVRAGIPLPLWNRNQGNISAAAAEVQSAHAEINRVELSLQNRLAGVYERYANAKAQSEKYAKTILPNAKSALTLVTQGYQQGEFGYLQLLTAQRTYFQTNLDYINALRELRESAITIEGLLLTESLGGGMPGGNSPSPAVPALGGGGGMKMGR